MHVDTAELDRCERMLTHCTCCPDYKERGRADPQCQGCDLGAEVIDAWRAMRRIYAAWQGAAEVVAMHGEHTYEYIDAASQQGPVMRTDKWAEVHADELPAALAGKRVKLVPVEGVS
jgi:hypothetical protein